MANYGENKKKIKDLTNNRYLYYSFAVIIIIFYSGAAVKETFLSSALIIVRL